MVWTSLLPVTIFLLINTLCVSQGATIGGAAGRQRLLEPLRSSDDGNAPPHRVDDFVPSGSSSSVEVVPEWVNSRHSTKDIEDETEIGDDGGNADWESVGGAMRYKYGGTDDDDRMSQLLYRSHLEAPTEMLEMAKRGGAKARRSLYTNAEDEALMMKLGGKLRYFPSVRRENIARQQPPAAMWTGKSYYQVPAEGFIRVNGYDKRSPRCIAKCMQQGMVHPLQCHSLC